MPPIKLNCSFLPQSTNSTHPNPSLTTSTTTTQLSPPPQTTPLPSLQTPYNLPRPCTLPTSTKINQKIHCSHFQGYPIETAHPLLTYLWSCPRQLPVPGGSSCRQCSRVCMLGWGAGRLRRVGLLRTMMAGMITVCKK